jgi:hypothetical protein
MDNKSSADKIHMNSEDIASVIIGLGFLILVGVIFVVTITTMTSVDSFLIVWTAVGPIVGVVIGSMPAYFFRRTAKTANDRRDEMAVAMAHMADRMAKTANDRADEMAIKMAHMGADAPE